MAFSMDEKINIFSYDGVMKAGIFSLQDNGNYLMIKNANINSKLYRKETYHTLDNEKNLIELLSDAVKKMVSRPEDLYSSIKEYSLFLHDLIDDFKEPKNRYFLSLSEKGLPEQLEKLAMKSLRIKDINDDPEDSYVLIITFYPGDESNRSNIVWNIKYQSEDVLLKKVEKIVYLMEDVPDNKKRSLINQIIQFLMNKMEEKIKKTVIEEDDDEQRYSVIEASILNSIFESPSKIGANVPIDKTELSKKEYDMWVLQGRPSEFYQFEYKLNSFRITNYKLKVNSDNVYYIEEMDQDRIRFDTIDDLIQKILALSNTKGHKIDNVLTDIEKVNMKRVIAKKYLYISVPFSELNEIMNKESKVTSNTINTNPTSSGEDRSSNPITIENTDTGKTLDPTPKTNDKELEKTLEEVAKKQEEFGIGNKYNPTSELGRDPQDTL